MLWHNIHVSPSYTSCMYREHRVQEGKVVFPLGVSVQGDVVVSVYHMRSTIGGRLQAKVISMCFTLHFYCKSQHHQKDQITSHVCVLIKIRSDKSSMPQHDNVGKFSLAGDQHQTASGCGCNWSVHSCILSVKSNPQSVRSNEVARSDMLERAP